MSWLSMKPFQSVQHGVGGWAAAALEQYGISAAGAIMTFYRRPPCLWPVAVIPLASKTDINLYGLRALRSLYDEDHHYRGLETRGDSL